MTPRRLRRLGRAAAAALLVPALVWALFPVYWMLITSLKTNLAM